MSELTVSRNPQDLGKVGEFLVGVWASQVGITVNPVRQDEHGWDYLFELPRAHSGGTNISLDLFPGDLRCFVQVKTLISSDGRSKIKLSNWQRMVTDRDPWFVLIIILDEDNNATDAFLVHVDEMTCASILKKLRALPESAISKLNKQYSDVSWKEDHRLERLHGLALQAALRFHIGDDLDDYRSMKKSWTDRAGYEDSPHSVRVAFPTSKKETAQEMLVDLLVGLRDDVACSVVETSETRFGIEKIVSKGGDGVISVSDRPPDGKTTVVFREGEPPVTAEIECDVFASQPHLDDVEERLHKIRFVAPLFSAILRQTPGPDTDATVEPTVTINFRWNFGPVDWEQDYAIRDLARTAQAALMLHRSVSNPIGLGFVVSGKPVWRDGFQASGVLDRNALRLWTRLYEVGCIARHFGIPETTAVRVDRLMDQELAVQFMAGSLENSDKTASFSVTADLSAEAAPAAPTAALVAVTSVRIGDTLVARCLALVGEPSWEQVSQSQQRLFVSSARLRLMSEWQVPVSEAESSNQSDRIANARRVLDDEGIRLIVADDNAP